MGNIFNMATMGRLCVMPSKHNYLHFPSALLGCYVIVGVCPSVCLSVFFFLSERRNSLTYWWIFCNFSHIIHICLSKSWWHIWDVNVIIAYFKATLTFMGPRPGRRSAFYECNSLVVYVSLTFHCFNQCFIQMYICWAQTHDLSNLEIVLGQT